LAPSNASACRSTMFNDWNELMWRKDGERWNCNQSLYSHFDTHPFLHCWILKFHDFMIMVPACIIWTQHRVILSALRWFIFFYAAIFLFVSSFLCLFSTSKFISMFVFLLHSNVRSNNRRCKMGCSIFCISIALLLWTRFSRWIFSVFGFI
jgi:hypothetical protein